MTAHPCQVCGAPAVRLCDWTYTLPERWRTDPWVQCDAPLCIEHTYQAGSMIACDRRKAFTDTTDYCPFHASIYQQTGRTHGPERPPAEFRVLATEQGRLF